MKPKTVLQAHTIFIEEIAAACQKYAEDRLRLTGEIPQMRPDDILSIGDKETSGHRYAVGVRFNWQNR